MEPIQSFCLSGVVSRQGGVSLSAHIGERTDASKTVCHLEWTGLPGIEDQDNLPDFLLTVLERAVEMFHTHTVMSFEVDNRDQGEGQHAL